MTTLGILKAGRPPSTLAARFGSYPDMFIRLFGAETFDYRVYDADGGELPTTPEDCDAYLVTGAARGAYDDLPWIDALGAFLRAARGRAPLVGICFGHQLMAQAFGGRVIASPKGWGLGEQTYGILQREPWMDDVATIRLPATHQDQVVEPPPGADIVAGSDFTPIGALAWRDHPSISLQLHPEYDPAFAVALIEGRRGALYPDDLADRVVASYAGPDDRTRVGGWIRNFLLAAT